MDSKLLAGVLGNSLLAIPEGAPNFSEIAEVLTIAIGDDLDVRSLPRRVMRGIKGDKNGDPVGNEVPDKLPSLSVKRTKWDIAGSKMAHSPVDTSGVSGDYLVIRILLDKPSRVRFISKEMAVTSGDIVGANIFEGKTFDSDNLVRVFVRRTIPPTIGSLNIGICVTDSVEPSCEIPIIIDPKIRNNG